MRMGLGIGAGSASATEGAFDAELLVHTDDLTNPVWVPYGVADAWSPGSVVYGYPRAGGLEARASTGPHALQQAVQIIAGARYRAHVKFMFLWPSFHPGLRCSDGVNDFGATIDATLAQPSLHRTLGSIANAAVARDPVNTMWYDLGFEFVAAHTGVITNAYGLYHIEDDYDPVTWACTSQGNGAASVYAPSLVRLA